MILYSEIFLLITSVILPLVLLMIYGLRREGSWKNAAWGAFGLLVCQIVLREPLLIVLSGNEGLQTWLLDHQLVYTLLVSALSALFECGFSWLVLRFLLRRPLSLYAASGYGLGYALMESLLFSGAGAISALLGSNPPDPALWGMVAARGFERLWFLFLHIGYALLLAKSIQSHRFVFFADAFALCFLILFFGSAAQAVWNLPLWITEVFLAIPALWLLWLFWKDRKKILFAPEED